MEERAMTVAVSNMRMVTDENTYSSFLELWFAAELNVCVLFSRIRKTGKND
jgi:hypothetical protein